MSLPVSAGYDETLGFGDPTGEDARACVARTEKSGVARPESAAKRCENKAHGASRGLKVETGQAPEERKNSCDADSPVINVSYFHHAFTTSTRCRT
jgi:hypothetical protein